MDDSVSVLETCPVRVRPIDRKGKLRDAIMALLLADCDRRGRRPNLERLALRCALPGCDEMTTHRGGYCCAGHCREHRARQRVTVLKQRSAAS